MIAWPAAMDPAVVCVPVALWLGVHVAHPDAAERVAFFGVAPVDVTKEHVDWRRLVLHSVAHGSPQHLLTNVAAHCLAGASFRPPLGLTLWASRLLAAGIMVGGAVAGVLAAKADAQRHTEAVEQQYPGVVGRLVGKIDRLSRDRVALVGASAAIMALQGYNCVDRRDPAIGLMCFLPDALAAASAESTLSLPFAGAFSVTADGSAPSEGLLKGVSHAGHLGGFFFGATVALLVPRLIRYANARGRGGARGQGRRLG